MPFSPVDALASRLVPEKLARGGANRSARRDIIRALVVLAVLAALWVVTSILLGRR